MKESWVKRLYSPWIVMVLSIVLSEAIYIIVGNFISGEVSKVGIILSFTIPAAASFPVALIMIKYHKRMEQYKNDLEYLNTLNKKLFSIIAHDIRSPIASTHALVELLISDKLSVREANRHLNDLAATVDNLLAFLEDLLLWSKKQIDREPTLPEEFDTEDIITDIIQLYKNVLSKKSISLKVSDIDEQVIADKGTYSFVVRNILQNAIKYTSEGGEITISVVKKKDFVYTVIEDNGIGIAKDRVASILNKSIYESTEGTDKELGTGFGLKTVIEYLETQNGKIEIESELGVGTKISILLPTATSNKIS